MDEVKHRKLEGPHWIHQKIKDPNYVSGFKYAGKCTCSVCGFVAGHEHDICPKCKSRMTPRT